jgi:hypothetical protein
MRVRTVLILTAIISSILGAVVVYLVMTVPNDLQADALMKTAKKHVAAGENDRAREALSRIVQEYPRTDAAAAATVALVSLADAERQKLQAELEAVRREFGAQQKQVTAIGQRVDELAARPVPRPVIVQVPAKKAAAKKASAKKSTKRTATRRRRH